MCRKKRILSAPDRSRHQAALWSSIAIKLLAPWHSLTPIHPRSSHSLVPSDFDGSPYQIGVWGNNTYGVMNRLSSLENYVQLLRVPRRLQPLLSLQRPNEPIQHATRAAFPETGSHVNKLCNGQDRTPEFALILFLRPSLSKAVVVRRGVLDCCPRTHIFGRAEPKRLLVKVGLRRCRGCGGGK